MSPASAAFAHLPTRRNKLACCLLKLLQRFLIMETTMSRIDDAFGISQQAQIFRSLRSSVLANNIANSETPNYLAKDFDFKTALDTASGGHLKMAVSDESHLGTSKQ